MKLSEENLLEFVSLATQDHLRTILEFLIKTSKQRVEMQKDDLIPTIITSDVKKKLNAIEKREREERTKKENEEQERLLREAKEQEVTSSKKKIPIIDDKSSNALKEKYAKFRLEKEERERTSAANSTALLAVGNIGKKKPLSAPFMKPSIFSLGANPQNIQPPIPSSQLISFQQLIKEGKTLTSEQEVQYQQSKENHENLLKQYHEKIGTKDYQPMDVDSNSTSSTNPSSTVGGRAGINNKHPNRKITKKDCYFSQKHIGYNVLQKYELLKLRKRFNPQNFPF